MKAAMPPRRWASAMTWRARVVLPEDSGPKISTTRPRGIPPTPRAASRESEPVGIAGTSTFSRLPRRMIEPLPNCLSICARAASIARARSFRSSTAICTSLRSAVPPTPATTGGSYPPVRPGRVHSEKRMRIERKFGRMILPLVAVLVHNPAAGASRAVSQRAFEKRWAGAGYWTLLVARDKAVAAPPTYEELVARGVAAGRRGSDAEAEDAFQRAIATAPSRPEARVELAGLRFLEKKYEDAAAGFASALIYQPDPYAREMLAASLHLAGHTEDALKEWNRLGQPRLDQVEIKGLVHTKKSLVSRELTLLPEGVLDLGRDRETPPRLG